MGRESDHSPPSSAEDKNVWRYSPTPLYVFMLFYLIKQDLYLYVLFVWDKLFKKTPECNSLSQMRQLDSAHRIFQEKWTHVHFCTRIVCLRRLLI
jgi:hypothetical protein